VVANAGITRDAPFHRMTPEQWNEVIGTNLTGVFNTIHPVWPGMRERKFGRVIVISSINGQKGQFGQVNYAATKAGDLGIIKSLAQEGARAGITANAVCPGYIGTEMVRAIPENVLNEKIIPQIPVGRLGEPEEIARCVTFLASDDAGFISGSTISANGAQYFGQWLAVLGLGLMPVGLAFYTWDFGVKRGDIQLLGVAAYAAPLLSTIILIAAGYRDLHTGYRTGGRSC
jgi:acetoacetyl-CoA reductase